MRTFVLSDAPDTPLTVNAQDTHHSEVSARLFLPTYKFNTKLPDVEEALWHIPRGPALAIMIGCIPKPEYYASMYQTLLGKDVRLINTPEESLRSQRLDEAYPYLVKTPLTRWADRLDEAEKVAAEIGYPVFVKGRTRSKKAKGWKHCVAGDPAELAAIVTPILETGDWAVIRQCVSLRHERTSDEGFPFGREFRVFLYGDQIMAMGYYWEGEDSLAELTEEENAAVTGLAREVALRIKVPFLVVDIGQQEDGEWIVVESGDAQFAGLSQINPLALWGALSAALADCPPP
jgi:hypothetical protein